MVCVLTGAPASTKRSLADFFQQFLPFFPLLCISQVSGAYDYSRAHLRYESLQLLQSSHLLVFALIKAFLSQPVHLGGRPFLSRNVSMFRSWTEQHSFRCLKFEIAFYTLFRLLKQKPMCRFSSTSLLCTALCWFDTWKSQ